jgi:hypothetical protein
MQTQEVRVIYFFRGDVKYAVVLLGIGLNKMNEARRNKKIDPEKLNVNGNWEVE